MSIAKCEQCLHGKHSGTWSTPLFNEMVQSLCLIGSFLLVSKANIVRDRELHTIFHVVYQNTHVHIIDSTHVLHYNVKTCMNLCTSNLPLREK